MQASELGYIGKQTDMTKLKNKNNNNNNNSAYTNSDWVEVVVTPTVGCIL